MSLKHPFLKGMQMHKAIVPVLSAPAKTSPQGMAKFEHLSSLPGNEVINSLTAFPVPCPVAKKILSEPGKSGCKGIGISAMF